jgi:S1-C subfamily serine protease
MRLAAGTLAALLTAGLACAQPQAPEAPPPGIVESLLKGIGGTLTNLVAGKDAYLASLVEKNELDAADRFYGSEKAHFSERGAENDPALRKLAEALNARLAQQLERGIETLRSIQGAGGPAQWPTIAERINGARGDLYAYSRYNVLQLEAFRSPRARALEDGLREIVARLAAEAPAAFRAYDHLSGAPFFRAYPVPLDEAALLSAGAPALLAQAERASAARILALAEKYPGMDEALRGGLAALYAARAMRERADRRAALYLAYQIDRELRRAGLGPAPAAGAIWLADATTEGGAAGVVLENDTGLALVRSREARADAQLLGANYVIVLTATANALARRPVARSEAVSRPAGAPAGARAAPAPPAGSAPPTEPAHGAPDEANPLAAIGNALARLLGRGEQAPKPAPAAAPAVPAALDPVYPEYAFTVTRVEVTRSGRILLSAWDRRGNGVARYSQPWKETRAFDIPAGIRADDPRREALLARYDSPAALEAFAQEPARVPILGPIESMIAAAPAFVPFAAGEGFFLPWQASSGTAEPPRAAKAAGAGQFDTQLASAVIVRGAKGIVGAGFYVAPFLVLASAQVAEAAKTVEVERHDGRKMDGRVVRASAALDVCLIEVPERGIPVVLQSGAIERGATVGAIGHAEGAAFGVVRGTAGVAVRARNRLAPGAQEVLAIPWEAARNPGNAGGPLFADGLLIGVSSPNLVDASGKNAGFAVHYSEIARFLRQ